MKLIKIIGDLWDLSIFQEVYNKIDNLNEKEKDELKEIILSKNYSSSRFRTYSDNRTRSKAKAHIEIIVNGLPQINSYVIYHNNKGFFCTVQQRKIYLQDLINK